MVTTFPLKPFKFSSFYVKNFQSLGFASCIPHYYYKFPPTHIAYQFSSSKEELNGVDALNKNGNSASISYGGMNYEGSVAKVSPK